MQFARKTSSYKYPNKASLEIPPFLQIQISLSLMDDLGAPSFSLGLDLDFDSETLRNPGGESIAERADAAISVSSESFDEDEGFRVGVGDRDLECECEEERRVFKRLRRGPQPQSSCATKIDQVPLGLNVDEEIEEFSSQEDAIREGSSLMQSHSLCSSSKLPETVLTRQSFSKPKGGKMNPISGASVSINLEASDTKLMFPKLTVSPIRRFQLLDSDSDLDDASIIENRCNDPHVGQSEKEKKSGGSQCGIRDQKRKAVLSTGMPSIEDLWKNFTPKEAVSISTPALDDFCEEYYRSSKDNNAPQCSAERMHLNSAKGYANSISENAESCGILHSLPPAYQYFFHDDPRIQRLVRDRLPNFSPLGVVDNQGNKSDAAAIDYMRQFGNGETSSQFYSKVNKILEGSLGGAKKNVKGSSTKELSQVSNIWQDPKSCVSKVQGGRAKAGKKNAKKPCAKEASQASSSWMNPKSSARNPKDAGRRRVHADSHSVGHWYTGQDGRKVYVTKNGQELTGQIAYKHYRKESGAGLKNSRKKTTSKKKSGR